LVANGATFQLAREREVMGLLLRVRRTPDRLLHPLRRRKALEALRARPRPKSVLVLCHGNICRSPIAAALLARALEPFGIQVQSGGFIGFNRPVPAEAITAAKRHRVELAEHRSRLVTAELVRAADLIVVMEPAQGRHVCERFGRTPLDVFILGDLDPDGVETRTIRDPVNQPVDVFEQTYARIARCVEELASALGGVER
jgi:protein-tyrosine phosphatase